MEEGEKVKVDWRPGEGTSASCPWCGGMGLRTVVRVLIDDEGHELIDRVEAYCPRCGWGR